MLLVSKPLCPLGGRGGHVSKADEQARVSVSVREGGQLTSLPISTRIRLLQLVHFILISPFEH